MNRSITKIFRAAFFSMFVLLYAAICSHAGEYNTLKGLNEIKTVFDVRAGKAGSVAAKLDLIQETFNDKSIREVTEKPEFVVIFMSHAVKFISKAADNSTEEEKELIDLIAETVREMKKEGIKLEVCLYAVNSSGIDPASLLPEIEKVDNGWISLIGYQAKGYSLVPAY